MSTTTATRTAHLSSKDSSPMNAITAAPAPVVITAQTEHFGTVDIHLSAADAAKFEALPPADDVTSGPTLLVHDTSTGTTWALERDHDEQNVGTGPAAWADKLEPAELAARYPALAEALPSSDGEPKCSSCGEPRFYTFPEWLEAIRGDFRFDAVNGEHTGTPGRMDIVADIVGYELIDPDDEDGAQFLADAEEGRLDTITVNEAKWAVYEFRATRDDFYADLESEDGSGLAVRVPAADVQRELAASAA